MGTREEVNDAARYAGAVDGVPGGDGQHGPDDLLTI
jgi:hypothetical protein